MMVSTGQGLGTDAASKGAASEATKAPLSSPVNGMGWTLVRELLRGVLRPLTYLAGYRVDGRANWPRGVPCIVVVNHAAFVDSVYVILAAPHRLTICGAKPRLFRSPGLRAVMALANILKVVDQDQFQQDCRHLLQRGETLLVYPEMGRYPDAMGPFKTWAAQVALASKVPVVPCYLYGTTRGQEGSPRLRVGRPMAPEDFESQNADELTAEIRRRIEALMPTGAA